MSVFEMANTLGINLACKNSTKDAIVTGKVWVLSSSKKCHVMLVKSQHPWWDKFPRLIHWWNLEIIFGLSTTHTHTHLNQLPWIIQVEGVTSTHWHRFLGGGFKYLLFSPRTLRKIPILTHIFQMGWFNHQLDLYRCLSSLPDYRAAQENFR